jgi:hypothetical protein
LREPARQQGQAHLAAPAAEVGDHAEAAGGAGEAQDGGRRRIGQQLAAHEFAREARRLPVEARNAVESASSPVTAGPANRRA